MVPNDYAFYRVIIADTARAHNLDPILVAAVCWQESAFQADAFRFEPLFWARYMAKLPRWAGSNPRRVSSSYGLGQIMYPVALEDGADLAYPELLFVPEIGLEATCKRLIKLQTWANALKISASDQRLALVAAYNGGRGGNNQSPFRNAAYASAVLTKLDQLKGQL